MEEMELLFPRAKKEVWVKSRDVRVMEAGERSSLASDVLDLVELGMEEWELTEEEVLQSEKQVQGYVLCFRLRDKEERH
jgi:hypothetical protein